MGWEANGSQSQIGLVFWNRKIYWFYALNRGFTSFPILTTIRIVTRDLNRKIRKILRFYDLNPDFNYYDINNKILFIFITIYVFVVNELMVYDWRDTMVRSWFNNIYFNSVLLDTFLH